MDFCSSLGELSTCRRASVGALICPRDWTQVYAIGYNGQPKGIGHDNCSAKRGICGCIHAETNAIVKLRADDDELTLLSTCSPCIMCAGLIINDGRIERVIYVHAYRDASGIALLEAGGILTYTYDKLIQRYERQ